MDTTLEAQTRAISQAIRDLQHEINRGATPGGYTSDDISEMETQKFALEAAIKTLKGLANVREFIKLLGD